ncbi:protein PLASTID TRANSCRIPTIONALLY ACTIVE 14-like [Lotus japonicus]|uniref:protein PLASTID TRANSCRIPTIONALLY ACTIVE 14-like n=1 Tax=Lotus japonicus TaxID=34305 RepID=UPI00258EE44C|nr:protein PLASTID TRANSCRIPTIONALLY ACTIVE 14-like [Lotus japonicus]XP_057434331.1 protein PLASTID TRANSCRIPTIONALLY ACTIVE 14-like [Lotus japonicus]XP_057434332.1 protein PLASTID TRANSCRIPTIONALLY ACTIVE 14-like [Lotus japonicus]
MQAYEIDFKEGPDGFGVYASKDVEPLRRPRVIMEIPLELMLTISKMLLWMLFPDIIPIGHPIFDIINSTNRKEELLELQDPNLASTNLILNYLFYSSKFDPLKHQSYYEGLLLSSF